MKLFATSLLVAHVSACLPDIGTLPPPVIHTECLKTQTGPTSYGCRNGKKLHGVLSKQRSFFLNRTSKHAVSSLEIASAMFAYCCRKSSLSEQCVPVCDYGRYTTQMVSSIISGHSECPSTALPALHSCASLGQDRRTCCVGAGVPSYCVRYCAPSVAVLRLGSRFPCLIYLEKMKGCFFSGTASESGETYGTKLYSEAKAH